MSVVPFTASEELDAAGPAQTDAVDARQRMLDVKQKLQDLAGDVESIQHALASQQELEQLLKQGKAHLQEMRNRLQLAVTERDRLQAESAASAIAHQTAIEGLERQLERQIDENRAELKGVTAERDRVAEQLAMKEAAHEAFACERTEERNTFKRLLDEASFTHREMTEEIEEQRQQIDTLREAAMRAQSFAREIMKAHEAAQAIPARSKP